MIKKLASLLAIWAIYILSLIWRQPSAFTYRFEENLIDRYFLCQDIPYEVAGKRLFLSDGEIHQAAGVLYWRGYDPAEVNFQHPPLLKYLFGLSIIAWGNPYYVQIILGMALLGLTFVFGQSVFKSSLVATLACLLLILDPFFSAISSDALLDLGQAVFLLLYIWLMLFLPKKTWLQGIILGLTATSKFWAAALFFVVVTFAFKVVAKMQLTKSVKGNWQVFKKCLTSPRFKQDCLSLIKQLVVAALTMCLVYLPAFIHQRGQFNILFFELKTLKYWFHHSVSSVPLASLWMFVTGSFKTWWDGSTSRTPSWSWLWPVSLLVSLCYGLFRLWRGKLTPAVFISLVSMLYLIYLGVQAPFERYFIIILPFLYLVLAKVLVYLLQRIKHFLADSKFA